MIPDVPNSEFEIVSYDTRTFKLNLDNKEEVINIVEKVGCLELLDYIKAEELPSEEKLQAPSIKEMKRLELADNESSSDSGNHRMYPNGQLMFNLIKDWQERIAKYELGAMEIGSPLFYNNSHFQIRTIGRTVILSAIWLHLHHCRICSWSKPTGQSNVL